MGAHHDGVGRRRGAALGRPRAGAVPPRSGAHRRRARRDRASRGGRRARARRQASRARRARGPRARRLGVRFARYRHRVSRDPALVILSEDPLTAETRLSALEDTIECAGNGRGLFEPRVRGEPWGLGAVGTASWTGVALRAVLERADPAPGAIEVLCAGADQGDVPELARRVAYERALPIAKALHEDTLIAYAMNGEPLPPDHGGPLRLVVPGWYGMASVKWLTRIAFSDEPLRSFYQTDRYVIDGRPLREIEPR